MNIKIVFYLLILLSFINPVNAIVYLDNANTTQTFHYSNQSNENIFQLNTTDNLKKISVHFNQWYYSQTQSYIFKDNSNNSLVIVFTYWKISGLLLNEIHRNVSVYYNNKPLLLSQKSLFSKTITAYEIEDKDSTSNLISNKDNLINIITFNPDVIWIDSNIFDRLLIITNVKNTFGYLSNPIYISRIELPYPDNTKYEITETDIDYLDNGISKFEHDLNQQFNGLSFPIQFIFIIFKAILKVFNILTFISDIDYYQYQSYFLTPLQMIDFLLVTFLNIIRFIFVMGLIWTFFVVEFVIIIINWIKTRDIIETVNNTIINSKNFWNIILIQPLSWIFTKLMLFWTSK